MLDILRQLIECQSTQGKPEEQEKCLQIIKREFKGVFSVAKRYKFKKRPILVLSNTNDKEVDIILAGHIDVVPANNSDFKLKTKKGNLYGRGVSDMKGPLVAALLATRDYLKNDNKLKIAIFITSDEEIDGLSTRYLIEKIKYRAKFAILPDGGNNFEVVTHQKGFLQVKINFLGEGGHASRPWEWEMENPIDLAWSFYNKFSSEWINPKNEGDWKSSAVLTKIEGGDAVNQAPKKVSLSFDTRYTKGQREKSLDKMKDILLQMGIKFVLEVIIENGPLIIDDNNPYVQKLQESMIKYGSKTTQPKWESGTSDAIFFAENGIPAVLCKPMSGGDHSAKEWVNEKSLFAFSQVILDFLKNI